MNKLFFLSALLISALSVNAQFSEGFEAGVPPAGWAIFDNGEGVGTDWTTSGDPNSGSDGAYINYDCSVATTSEDWLVTPQILISAGDVLTFYHKDIDSWDYGSSYEIRISTTSQTLPGSFTTEVVYTESMVPVDYTQQVVDLSAYDGMNIYVAFVQVQDCGDSWFIDDVYIGTPPCLPPTNLMVTGTTSTTADLAWTPFSASLWDISVVDFPQGPGAYSTVSSSAFTTGTLAPGSYNAHVREVCTNSSPLMITGVIDGPLAGGLPKAIELYAVEDIADLSIFGVSSANNGGGTTGAPEFTFPADMISAGTYIYVTTDSAGFNNFMGFDADYVEGIASNINGDDAVELFMNGNVVDVFGDVNVDGTGQAWEYLDGWAYRNSGTLSNDGIFMAGNWTFSGINALDGETTNATSVTSWPNGTFTTTPDKSNWITINFCIGSMGDDTADAIAIPSLPYADTSSTAACYSDIVGNPSEDVFYRLVVNDPCLEAITLDLCDGLTDYDTYLRIFDTQLNELSNNDDDCGLQSAIYDFAVSGYDTLYIVVEGYDVEVGNYVLNVTPVYYDSLALISQTDVTCAGDTTGSATVDNGEAGFTFEWNDMAMQTGTTANNLPDGTYIVTATHTDGCVYTDTVNITTLYPALTANPAITDVDCFGNATGSVILNEGGGAGGTILVDWGGENPGMLAAGTYVYTLTDTAGCMMVDSVEITEPADLSLSATSTPEATANDGAIDLTVSGGTPPYTYSWTNGAGTSEDPSGLAGNMSYTVTVTDDNGCSDTLTVYVANVVGIDANNMGSVRLYPNPNNGAFTLELPATISANTDVRVFDASGQLVEEFVGKPGINQVSFDQLVRGTYILHIVSDNSNYQIRFTVM